MIMRRTSNTMVLKKGELVCILIFVMQFVARRSTIHERHANAHRFPWRHPCCRCHHLVPLYSVRKKAAAHSSSVSNHGHASRNDHDNPSVLMGDATLAIVHHEYSDAGSCRQRRSLWYQREPCGTNCAFY